MRSSDFILLFFIIYDVIITWLFLFIWYETKERSKKKDEIIDFLHNELAKKLKK